MVYIVIVAIFQWFHVGREGKRDTERGKESALHIGHYWMHKCDQKWNFALSNMILWAILFDPNKLWMNCIFYTMSKWGRGGLNVQNNGPTFLIRFLAPLIHPFFSSLLLRSFAYVHVCPFARFSCELFVPTLFYAQANVYYGTHLPRSLWYRN